MKCPHCLKVSRSKVLESRSCHGTVWRRRRCSICQKTFVSAEVSDVDTKMPNESQWRHRAQAAEARTGAHLQGVWR